MNETWYVKNQSEKGQNNDIPKTPKGIRWLQLKTGNEHVEIVQQYTYLGTRLTPTGNFTLILLHFYMPPSVYGNLPSLIDLIPIPRPRFLTQ